MIIKDGLFFANSSDGKYSADYILEKAKEAIETNKRKAEKREARKAMKDGKKAQADTTR
jgi:hypothetical protein